MFLNGQNQTFDLIFEYGSSFLQNSSVFPVNTLHLFFCSCLYLLICNKFATTIFALALQEEHVPAVSFFEVMRLNLSEWPYLLVGSIGAVINGAMQPSFAAIFSKIIGVGFIFIPTIYSIWYRMLQL